MQDRKNALTSNAFLEMAPTGSAIVTYFPCCQKSIHEEPKGEGDTMTLQVGGGEKKTLPMCLVAS